jgi:hypothetical protein
VLVLTVLSVAVTGWLLAFGVGLGGAIEIARQRRAALQLAHDWFAIAAACNADGYPGMARSAEANGITCTAFACGALWALPPVRRAH